jgi:DNA-binding HxlR family transcriptional regulator
LDLTDRNREGVVASFRHWYAKMNLRTPGLDCDPAALVSAWRVIGGKWKIKIIFLLLDGKKRFGELRRRLPGIGRGVLSYELRQLQKDDIVKRTQYQTIPPTVEYTLTRKGMALHPLLIELRKWSTTFSES